MVLEMLRNKKKIVFWKKLLEILVNVFFSFKFKFGLRLGGIRNLKVCCVVIF